MTNRAETIWSTYQQLRQDVVMGDRCSSVCNETLMNFVNAMASFYSAMDLRELPKNPTCQRYMCDDSLNRADRLVEGAVTGMA